MEAKTQPPVDRSCGLSVEDHALAIVFTAFAYAGIGTDCPEVYKGFLAAAAFIKQEGGHVDVTADDSTEIAAAVASIKQKFDEVVATLKAQRAANRTSSIEDFFAPDTVDALDPKKLN
jgi:hypothetical protein